MVTAGSALTTADKSLSCAGSSTAYTCIASGVNNNVISDGSVATVAVTLAAGATSASVGVSGGSLPALDSSPIATTTTGGTASIVAAAPLTGLACNPASLAPGAVAVCTLTLSGPVISAATVALSSTGNITVPATVSVASNAASAAFNVTAGSFTADQSATVTPTWNAASATATISLVAPIQITSLQCGSTTLAAYASTTCTITLSKAASSGGSIISLSRSTSALTVPASALVPSGATTATFTATAAGLVANQNATVTSSLGASTASVAFSITAANPPVISNIQASGVTSSSATITWTTDVNSDSQVEYGTSTAYGLSSALNSTAVTAHSVTLSGLAASMVYHYRVKSRNTSGLLAVSSDNTFTTAAGIGGPTPVRVQSKERCGNFAAFVAVTFTNSTTTGNELIVAVTDYYPAKGCLSRFPTAKGTRGRRPSITPTAPTSSCFMPRTLWGARVTQ